MPKKFSKQFLDVFTVFSESANQWMSVADVAEKSDVNVNTAKQHIRFLYSQQALERLETYPYVYRLLDNATDCLPELETILDCLDLEQI